VLGRVREYMQFKLGHKTYVGMLHRLDRDTSGSLAVALSKDAHAAGRELFKAHRFERHYLALVQGIPESAEGHDPRAHFVRLSRRPRKLVGEDKSASIAHGLQVRERLKDAALLELRLHTGRQHSDPAAPRKDRHP
jgi:23S rRNA pseudouridine1911/1915/1917 synthase